MDGHLSGDLPLAIGTELDVDFVEAIGDHLHQHAFTVLAAYLFDGVDEGIVFQGVSELFYQSSLQAGIDLHEDDLAEGKGHNPDVAVLVHVVSHVLRVLNRQF